MHLGWDVVSVAAGGAGTPIRPVQVEGTYTPPAYLLADSSGRLHTAGVDVQRPDLGMAIADVRDILGHPQIVVAGATWPAELVFRARMYNPLAAVGKYLRGRPDVVALPFPDGWPDEKIDVYAALVEQLDVAVEPLPESVALSGYVRALGLVRPPGARDPRGAGATGVYSDGRTMLVVAVHGDDDQPTESVDVPVTAEALRDPHSADNVVIEVMAAARSIGADTSTVLLCGNVCFNDALRLAFQNHLGHRFRVADHPMHALVLGATHLLVTDSDGEEPEPRPEPPRPEPPRSESPRLEPPRPEPPRPEPPRSEPQRTVEQQRSEPRWPVEPPRAESARPEPARPSGLTRQPLHVPPPEQRRPETGPQAVRQPEAPQSAAPQHQPSAPPAAPYSSTAPGGAPLSPAPAAPGVPQSPAPSSAPPDLSTSAPQAPSPWRAPDAQTPPVVTYGPGYPTVRPEAPAGDEPTTRVTREDPARGLPPHLAEFGSRFTRPPGAPEDQRTTVPGRSPTPPAQPGPPSAGSYPPPQPRPGPWSEAEPEDDGDDQRRKGGRWDRLKGNLFGANVVVGAVALAVVGLAHESGHTELAGSLESVTCALTPRVDSERGQGVVSVREHDLRGHDEQSCPEPEIDTLRFVVPSLPGAIDPGPPVRI